MIRKPAVSHCQTEFTCHTQGKETYGCCLPLSSSEIKQKALSEVVDTRSPVPEQQMPALCGSHAL